MALLCLCVPAPGKRWNLEEVTSKVTQLGCSVRVPQVPQPGSVHPVCKEHAVKLSFLLTKLEGYTALLGEPLMGKPQFIF